nr:MAG TPA: hypothetical protein [Caudoviricetes sp.]
MCERCEEKNSPAQAAKHFYEMAAPATLTGDTYRNNLDPWCAGYELVSSEVILEK